MLYRVIVSFKGAFDLPVEAQSEDEAEAKADRLISEDYEGKYDCLFMQSASVYEICIAK